MRGTLNGTDMKTILDHVLRDLLKKPATRRYPAEKRSPPPGARGRLAIDLPACIYCGLCAKKCPAQALEVTRQPNPKSWTLDPYRCILCGYCVEICPPKCLRLEPEHFTPPPADA